MSEDDEQFFQLLKRDSFACIYNVHEGGYEWDTHLRAIPSQNFVREVDSQSSLWLDAGLIGVEQNSRRYQPLLELDLHRQFGRLKPTCKSVKRFADRYGLLGNLVFLHYPELEGQPQSVKYGESFEFWVQEIKKMSDLLDLWDYIQYGKQVSGLRIIRHYQPKLFISLEWHFPGGGQLLHSIAHEGVSSEKELVTQLLKEAIYPARLYFLKQLQERMKGRVNPQLNLYNTGQILMVPDSLLSALYVSFALEVCGKMEPLVKCRGCDEYFPPGMGRKYHDNNCKERDWWRHNRGKVKTIDVN